MRDLPRRTWTDLGKSPRQLEHRAEYLAYLEDIDPDNRLYFTVVHQEAPVAFSQAVLTSDRTLPLSRPSDMLASPPQVPAGPADPQTTYETLLYPSVVVRNLWDCLPLVRPGETDASRWWPALFESIEEYARTTGVRSVTCLNAPLRTSALGSFLLSRGYLCGHYCAVAEIDLSGVTSFSQYLQRFTGDTRRGILRERRHFRQAGLTVQRLTPEQHLHMVVEQEARNWERHGETVDIDYLYSLRHSLTAHLGDRALLMGACTAEGDVIASGIHLSDRGIYHVFTFGADYRHGDLAASYQEITFYAAVEAALRRGAASVNLGYEGYQAKALRGAAFRDMYAYVLPGNPQDRAFTESVLEEVSQATARQLASVVVPRTRLPAR